MSNHARRVKLTEFVERRRAEASVIIEADDGTEFVIPPHELWPDATSAPDVRHDLQKLAPLILGVDEFDRFKAAGGSAKILNAIFIEAQGADLPES